MEDMAEEGFEISEEAVEKIGEAQARAARLGHFALWFIVAIMIFYFFLH